MILTYQQQKILIVSRPYQYLSKRLTISSLISYKKNTERSRKVVLKSEILDMSLQEKDLIKISYSEILITYRQTDISSCFHDRKNLASSMISFAVFFVYFVESSSLVSMMLCWSSQCQCMKKL